MPRDEARSERERTHAQRITKAADHSGVFGDGVRHTEKTPTLENMEETSMTVDCECGEIYSPHTHTVCPRCFAWPKKGKA